MVAEPRVRAGEYGALASLPGAGEAVALGLDQVIHARVRLGIVSALAANQRLAFNELKGLLQTSDGNLSAHARKLEDAGYIACRKSFVDRTPRTEYSLTVRGRTALDGYLAHMEALIQAAR